MYTQPRKRRCLSIASSSAATELLSPPRTISAPVVPTHPHPEDLAPEPDHQEDDLPMNPEFPCRVCGLSLSTSSNRTRHERLKHNILSSRGKKRGVQSTAPSMEAPTSTSPSDDSAASEGEGSNSDSEETEEKKSSREATDPSMEDAKQPHEETSIVDVNEKYAAMVLDEVKQNSRALKDLSRPMLLDAEMQQAFFPFLTWLAQPPVTSCEAMVKARRINSQSQLQPIKFNLRFIFGLLYERGIVNEVSIDALTKSFVCKSLYEAVVERQVGSSRIHVLFLLVKKALVYLSSKESVEKKQFLQPSTIESYFYVDSICSEHSNKRKQESRNRAVLGVEGSRVLAETLHQERRFEIPTSWSGEASTPPRPAVAPQAQDAAPKPSKDTTMTKQELQQVAQKCLSMLDSPRWKQEPSAHRGTAIERDTLFVSYLVTATLCLGLAPRSQILKQLQVGSSFEKNEQDGRYWVKILAEMSKNGKPTMFALPVDLTPAYDLYLQVIRPRMLERCSGWKLTKVDLRHKYVFFKRSGDAPRAEFSSLTQVVTRHILQRPINAHAFRTSIITTFYGTGASQNEMDNLADIMAHSPATARQFYHRPQFNQMVVQANDRMSDILLRR